MIANGYFEMVLEIPFNSGTVLRLRVTVLCPNKPICCPSLISQLKYLGNSEKMKGLFNVATLERGTKSTSDLSKVHFWGPREMLRFKERNRVILLSCPQ